jgi:hypothetical protein
VEYFERQSELIESLACRQNAERFAPQRFRDELSAYVDRQWRRAEARRRKPQFTPR